MVSNDVLEWNLGNVYKQLAIYKSKKKNPPEELVERKDHLEMSISLLSGELRCDCKPNFVQPR